MNEEKQPGVKSVKRPRKRRRWSWRWTVGVALAVAALLLAVMAVWYPSHLISVTTKRLGYDMEVGDLQYHSVYEIELRDIAVGDFARLERVTVIWSLLGLLKGEVDEIRAYGSRLWVSKLKEWQSERGGKDRSDRQAKEGASPGLVVKHLILADFLILVDDLGEAVPPIPLRLGEVTPIVIRDYHLGEPGGEAAQEIYVQQLRDFRIDSPYDPLAPVITIEEITVGFSWAGLQQNQLEQLVLTNPKVYIGNDLFWFVDKVKEGRKDKEEEKKEEEKDKGIPWTVGSFEVIGGRMVLTTFGRPGVMLPPVFEAHENGLVFGDWSRFHLKSKFKIKKMNQPYPKYGLDIMGLDGELSFSLPPGEADTDNIVQSIKIDKIKWKGLEVNDGYLGLTFDRKGIFGVFDTKAYGGDINLGFAVYLDKGFPWTGWGSTTHVDVEPVTKLLTPENFLMKGPVESHFLVRGEGTKIVGLGGKVKLDQPGRLSLPSVQDVLDRIPEEWNSLKKEGARIVLEAFQTYDYHRGESEFAYIPPESFLRLDLEGKQGKRNFDIRWHDERKDPYSP